MNHVMSSLLGWAALLAIPLATTGCGAEDASSPPLESVAVAEESGRIVLNSWTDWSGLVRVTLYACDWSAKVAHPEARCALPVDDVIVGGGAEIEGDAHPGALITASYPISEREWAVASKDHVRSFPHRIRARALGLRLTGVSSFDLELFMFILKQTAQGGSNTSIARTFLSSANCSSGCLMVGGGARAEYTGSGHLLYESQGAPDAFSEPDGTLHPDVWLASSKAHHTSDTSGKVTSYLIGIPRCPRGFAGGCLTNALQTDQLPNATGYTVLTSAVGQFWGYALTSVGGVAFHNGAGRMLTDLYPYFSDPSRSPAGRATSKDHITADASRSTLITLLGLATEM